MYFFFIKYVHTFLLNLFIDHDLFYVQFTLLLTHISFLNSHCYNIGFVRLDNIFDYGHTRHTYKLDSKKKLKTNNKSPKYLLF